MLMSIKTRLIALFTALGVLLLGSTGLRNYALYSSYHSLQTLFADRVVCLSQFSEIRDAYESILKAMRSVSSNESSPRDASKVIVRQIARSKEVWAAYMTTYLTPEEEILAAEVGTQLERDESIVEDLSRRLDGGGRWISRQARTNLLSEMEPTAPASRS